MKKLLIIALFSLPFFASAETLVYDNGITWNGFGSSQEDTGVIYDTAINPATGLSSFDLFVRNNIVEQDVTITYTDGIFSHTWVQTIPLMPVDDFVNFPVPLAYQNETCAVECTILFEHVGSSNIRLGYNSNDVDPNVEYTWFATADVPLRLYAVDVVIPAPTGFTILSQGAQDATASNLGANVSLAIGSVFPMFILIVSISLAFFVLYELMKLFGYVGSRKKSFFFDDK